MVAVEERYGNRIRVRVCGVLKHQDKLLMLNHKGLTPDNIFWNVPGGGVEPNETLLAALKREFREETHLQIQVHELLYVNEFIQNKLHAIELYFRVSCNNLVPKLGMDPELNLLTQLKWFSKEELENLTPSQCPAFIVKIGF